MSDPPAHQRSCLHTLWHYGPLLSSRWSIAPFVQSLHAGELSCKTHQFVRVTTPGEILRAFASSSPLIEQTRYHSEKSLYIILMQGSSERQILSWRIFPLFGKKNVAKSVVVSSWMIVSKIHIDSSCRAVGAVCGLVNPVTGANDLGH